MIFWLYENLMKDYLNTKELIPEENFCEIRYEDLLAHPEVEVQKIYDQLNSGENVRENVQIMDFIASQKAHKTDAYILTKQEYEALMERWGFAMKKWNYRVPDNIKIIEK